MTGYAHRNVGSSGHEKTESFYWYNSAADHIEMHEEIVRVHDNVRKPLGKRSHKKIMPSAKLLLSFIAHTQYPLSISM